jgi:glycosyltransferase involved in cell wall biosynthesis
VNRHKRLSICYAVPGHNLLTSAGPTRNVLYLAEALSQWAEVTVAFRRILEPFTPHGYKVIEVEQGADDAPCGVDDAAIRDMSVRQFLAYLRAIRRFVKIHRQAYDVVLEKSWLLSGYLTALCRGYGLPAVVVENLVRVWHEPLEHPRDLLRYTRYRCTQVLVGRYLRQAPLIIAETEALKTALTRQWSIPTTHIAVVGLGVNRHLFRPLHQAEARQELGMAPDATILLYAGALDQTHNLAPVLEAMREVSDPLLELHVVGDGVLRQHYEAIVLPGQRNVVFHGRVPHTVIPQYVAAADLCLAPYELQAFPQGQVAYSTLKIPEYMACARPVISVPSGHIATLIQHGITGFLLPNTVQDWTVFLCHCPPRAQLRYMGEVAVKRLPAGSWEETALAYLSLCKQAVMGHGQGHQSRTTRLV